MPYEALKRTKALKLTFAPPAIPLVSIPSDIVITSGSTEDSLTLTRTSSLLSRDLLNVAVDRAQLFTHGKHDDLMIAMTADEKRTMFSWLHQFWYFAFKAAKYWGRGPRTWKRDLLAFDTFQKRSALPFSPGIVEARIGAIDSSDEDEMASHVWSTAPKPAQICSWVVHLSHESFDKIAQNLDSSTTEEIQPDTSMESSFPEISGDNYDLNEESGMEMHHSDILLDVFDHNHEEDRTDWPDSWMEKPFSEVLLEGLETNYFSTIPMEEMPIPSADIAEAVSNSREQLFVEALGFSIIAGNERLVYKMLQSDDMEQANLSKIFPFHLAVAHLDSSKVCCELFSTLVRFGKTSPYLRELYVNDLGHTVLDSLMVTILKSHTDVSPSAVADLWNNETSFPGAQVDICGRWDADSDCVRALHEAGSAVPPFDWKHKFCHASAQAICHCIRILFAFSWSPDINTPSGLFVKSCAICNLRLYMRPLHTLVMTAACVLKKGSKDEDLFGIIACALCLISNGADPRAKAQISLEAFSSQESSTCSHEELTPAALAKRLAPPTVTSKAASAGWDILTYILDSASVANDDGHQNDAGLNDERVMSCESDTGHYHPFGRNKILATLWAIVQADFLTYRRQKEEDTWQSENFDACAVWESIKVRGRVSSGFLEKNQLRSFCHCGRFSDQIWRNERIEDVWINEEAEDMGFWFLSDEVIDKAMVESFPKRNPSSGK